MTAAPAERRHRAAPLTPTHQRVLDLRAQLEARNFDWGCLNSFSAWLAFSFGVGTVHELDEHEALEAANLLASAIDILPPAPPAPGQPGSRPQPPGSGA